MAGESVKGGKIVLVGNPNVGKSVIFRLLTGSYVLVSNFPGTTVEISRGRMVVGGRTFEVVDTPGVNSLVPQSEDEFVTCEVLLRERPDVIVQVADAKNLRRTLLITSQLVEFGIPAVLVLNMMDEAEERGLAVDTKRISELFSIPVVETVAIYSRGRKQLLQAIQNARPPGNPLRLPPVAALERAEASGAPSIPAALCYEWLSLEGRDLTSALDAAFGRGTTERLNRTAEWARASLHRPLAREVASIRTRLVGEAAEAASGRRSLMPAQGEGGAARPWMAALLAGLALFAWNRLGPVFGIATPYSAALELLARWAPSASDGLAGGILFGRLTPAGFDYGLLPEVVHFLLLLAPVIVPLGILLARNRHFAHEIGILSRKPSTGIPILLLVLLLVYEFVGYTGAQTLVKLLEGEIFGRHLIPALARALPAGLFADFLVGRWGMVSMGLTYALAIVLPVVATFFIAFSLLEDSGYIPRLSILADRVMRRMGLNGKAVLPMVLGLGCVTMATMTTRILASRKERLIATLLLALGIPCSAQLGVVLGMTAGISMGAMLVVGGVVASQLFLVGFIAGRLLPGRPGEFIFEIPPIRAPQMKNVLLKTAYRVRWYLKEAVPLFLAGTLALYLLGNLQARGRSLLDWLQAGLAPIVRGLLHLPDEAAGVFVMGFLRRDYGAAGLFAMAQEGRLTNQQAVVSLIVITLFVPCLASFLVVIKEQGLRRALAITAFIIPFAIAVGSGVSLLLRSLNIRFA